MDNTEELNKIDRIALALFGFMQQCRLNVTFTKNQNKLMSYQFTINDMTNLGEPFGVGFEINYLDVENVPDTPSEIEAYCCTATIKMGLHLLTERASRLLQYPQNSEKSKIIIPK